VSVVIQRGDEKKVLEVELAVRPAEPPKPMPMPPPMPGQEPKPGEPKPGEPRPMPKPERPAD
jgi:hypothetical protein